MKLYKNEKGQIVFDGDGITTIQMTENIKGVNGVNEWLKGRLVADGFNNFVVTGFCFKWPENKGDKLI